jgi:hypothetical protein
MWAYEERDHLRAYAIGPARDGRRDSEDALFAVAKTPDLAASVLRRQIDAELADGDRPRDLPL